MKDPRVLSKAQIRKLPLFQDLTHRERIVLLVIYGLSRHGHCYAKLEYLAECTDFDPRTVKRATRDLRDRGLLRVERKPRTALYFLDFKRLYEGTPCPLKRGQVVPSHYIGTKQENSFGTNVPHSSETRGKEPARAKQEEPLQNDSPVPSIGDVKTGDDKIVKLSDFQKKHDPYPWRSKPKSVSMFARAFERGTAEFGQEFVPKINTSDRNKLRALLDSPISAEDVYQAVKAWEDFRVHVRVKTGKTHTPEAPNVGFLVIFRAHLATFNAEDQAVSDMPELKTLW